MTHFFMIFLFCGGTVAPAEIPACKIVPAPRGGPAILIEGRTFSPLFFAANNNGIPDENVLAQVRLAGANGIDLISFNVSLDWEEPAGEALEVIAAFCQANPSAYYYLRVWLGGSPKWIADHPEAWVMKHDGLTLPWASPASPVWRADAERLLRRLLDLIRHAPYSDRFIGICPTALNTGEWFFPEDCGPIDYSPPNLAAFREWLRATYRSHSRLRRAWNNPAISFDTVAFPSPEEFQAAAAYPFRDPISQRPVMDAQRFQSALIAGTIEHFARVVKAETKNRSLVGAFYGYTLELNHNGPTALARSGHLALARLLQCPDLDLIHAPYSYFERGLGNPSHFHLPVDSIAAHGKLVIIEDDTYTHLSKVPADRTPPPGFQSRTDSLEQTLALVRGNAAAFFTHGCGLWYFDLLQDGRWNSEEFWKSAALVRRWAAESRTPPGFQPEIAFIANEEAVSALPENTHPILLDSLGQWRAELDRLGAPVGYYLQSDLPRLPISVKLLILANPYRISESEQRALRRFLARGGTVLWTLAPGTVPDTGVDWANAVSLTGFALKPKPNASEIELTNELSIAVFPTLAPDFPLRVVPEAPAAHVIARYADTNEPAAAAIPFGGGVSIYTITPRLPTDVLRWIGRNSGVHFYRSLPGPTALINRTFVVHTDAEATEEFRWPRPFQRVERLLPPAPSPLAVNAMSWTDRLQKNTTAVYTVTE